MNILPIAAWLTFTSRPSGPPVPPEPWWIETHYMEVLQNYGIGVLVAIAATNFFNRAVHRSNKRMIEDGKAGKFKENLITQSPPQAVLLSWIAVFLVMLYTLRDYYHLMYIPFRWLNRMLKWLCNYKEETKP